MAFFYTSDLHFMHRMVAGTRGFWADPGVVPDFPAHDAVIIRNWNRVVTRYDITFVLGDLTIQNPRVVWPLLDQLNGRKVLITGNHDAPFPKHRDAWKHQAEWMQHFDAVVPHARRLLEGEEVLLSHFPYEGDHTPEDRYTQYRLRDEGLTIVHGHVHAQEQVTRTTRGTLQIHAGVDAWDMTPVAEAQIMRIIRDERKEAA